MGLYDKRCKQLPTASLFILIFITKPSIVIVLPAKRNVHLISTNHNLSAMLNYFTIYDSGNHCRLASAPANSLNFLYLVCVY